VAPDSGLAASGSLGGPFHPGNQVYTLINTGDATLNWMAANMQNWLSLSSSSGALAPGESKTLTVSIEASAALLPVGSYADTVVFTNTSNGQGNSSRNMSLRIRAVPPAQLTLDASANHGQLRLRLTAEPGKLYRIETSTDLQTWTPLFTNTIAADGFFEFTELTSGASAQQYYRAVLMP
jgi:hypothetical protein